MRRKSLLNWFHIKISSCIHRINSHAKYIVVFDQWDRNYYKKINLFEFEIFATMYDRDIDFAKFEIVKIVKIFEIFFLFSNSLCVFFVCFFALISFCFRCCWIVLSRNELIVHLIESLTVHLIWKRLSRNRKIELRSLLKVWSEKRIKHRRFEIKNKRSNKLKWKKSHRKRLTKKNLYARNKINDFSILESREFSTSEIVKNSLSFFCTISFFCC